MEWHNRVGGETESMRKDSQGKARLPVAANPEKRIAANNLMEERIIPPWQACRKEKECSRQG